MELPKVYEAKDVEAKWRQFWEEGNFFKADPFSSKPAYCIVLPPPNVTGALHMGHALVDTLQDILIRWKRMLGFETLWVPGTDHAGIATQTVVEKHLIKTMGKRRKDFTREEFLHHVWYWKDTYEKNILGQLKHLGCSCDWSRLRFTMDAQNNRAVKTMFKKLFEAGLIYRGEYLGNWDPVTQTALADDEVEYEERQSFLWYFKYPVKDSQEFATFATTRPETVFGDTAIAVSPRDERYHHLIGRTVVHPLTKREIPIIADHLVDPSFGTGMVKITPSHDYNDYQMGLNHHLPFVNIMTPDGKLNQEAGSFAGLTMEEGRVAVVEEMKKLGLLEKAVPHVNRVGVSYRSKAVIEPYMSKQWFIRMEQFGQHLKAAVVEGKTRLIPKNWENTYFHWINNLRDWCISRQLWWGHRIPVWYRKDNPDVFICDDSDDVPLEVKQNPDLWIQDEDVLDTWFSSALWPFSTLGWPDHTQELKKFYPNSVLVTGHDILFFWVARMMLMGEYALGELPFPEVFLHGLIYGKSYWKQTSGAAITYLTDKERKDYDLGAPLPTDVQFKWEKMSKTKGNVIDPLEVIDEYGTDAIRMALCSSATSAREIDLDRRRFEDFKNFANKIWNGTRFVLMNLTGDEDKRLSSEQLCQGLDLSLLKLEDRWILSTLHRTIAAVNEALEQYAFDQAALKAYEFFWRDFCSSYVEISKPVLFGKTGSLADRQNKQKLLLIVLCASIRLIHPIAPFITEEIFQILKELFSNLKITDSLDPYTQEAIEALLAPACTVAIYPKAIKEALKDDQALSEFTCLEKAVYTIRNIRGEMKLPPSMATDLYFIGLPTSSTLQLLRDNLGALTAQVRLNQVIFQAEDAKLALASTAFVEDVKIVIPIPQELIAEEQLRLKKEKERLTQSLEKIDNQLGNSSFIERAPAHLVQQQRELKDKLRRELKEIEDKLQLIGM